MDQVAWANQAPTCSARSPISWHTEVPAHQEKAGEMPHTLHERRPPNNEDIQQNNQTDCAQQTEQQRESWSEENRETGLGEAAGWQETAEPTPRGIETLSPDPFFAAFYGDEVRRKAMASTTPRKHQERMQLHEGDWCQAKHQAE